VLKSTAACVLTIAVTATSDDFRTKFLVVAFTVSRSTYRFTASCLVSLPEGSQQDNMHVTTA